MPTLVRIKNYGTAAVWGVRQFSGGVQVMSAEASVTQAIELSTVFGPAYHLDLMAGQVSGAWDYTGGADNILADGSTYEWDLTTGILTKSVPIPGRVPVLLFAGLGLALAFMFFRRRR